jgi:hypothetical protein
LVEEVGELGLEVGRIDPSRRRAVSIPGHGHSPSISNRH